jgi:transglutaminase-like putative cysteine protease
MTWRMRIRHATGYRYDDEVSSSYNEARLTPLTGQGQLTLESSIETSPDTKQFRYWDYWGTQVSAFDVHRPHRELEVTATSLVDTQSPLPPPTGATWEQLRDEDERDKHVELLMPSVRAVPDEVLTELALRESAGLTPYDATIALLTMVHDRVAYKPGTTGVSTSAQEAWQLGAGVCQDIVHVSLALLRAAGIPARYVSGYLHPNGADAPIGTPVLGESHAWVEVWLGSWWQYDPTGLLPADQRHVIVAKGRDYSDVPPLKGVFAGGGSQYLGVSVEVTRLA